MNNNYFNIPAIPLQCPPSLLEQTFVSFQLLYQLLHHFSSAPRLTLPSINPKDDQSKHSK